MLEHTWAIFGLPLLPTPSVMLSLQMAHAYAFLRPLLVTSVSSSLPPTPDLLSCFYFILSTYHFTCELCLQMATQGPKRQTFHISFC